MSNRAFQQFWPENSLFPPAYPWFGMIVPRNHAKMMYERSSNKSKAKPKVTGIGLVRTIGENGAGSRILSTASYGDSIVDPLGSGNIPNIWISYSDWNPFYQGKSYLIELLQSHGLNEETVRMVSDMGEMVITDLRVNGYGVVYYGIAIYMFDGNYFVAYVIEQDMGNMVNMIPQNSGWQPQIQGGFSLSFGELFQRESSSGKDFEKGVELHTSDGIAIPGVEGSEGAPKPDGDVKKEEDETGDTDKETKSVKDIFKEDNEEDDEFRYPPWLEGNYIHSNENTLNLIKMSYMFEIFRYIRRNY
jgi:hypothetical protein